MTKKDIEMKLRFIEAEKEMRIETMKWSKKSDRGLLFISVSMLIAILIMYRDSSMNVVSVMGISLFVCNVYNIIVNMVVNKRDDEHKLNMLKLDEKFYTARLKEFDKCEDEGF